MREGGRVLQICPHDVPPFADLCQVYAQALQHLGLNTVTVFIAPPHGTPVPGAVYLNVAELSRSGVIGRLLRDKFSDTGIWALAICHRYRSWRVLVNSGIRPKRTLVVAHEFRFFDRRPRRWLARFARNTTFAGVSPAVTLSMIPYARDVVTMPNAIDVDAVRETMLDRETARELLGLKPGPFTLGVVGRLHPKKQPAMALAAFQRASLPNARIVFLGDGPLRELLDTGRPDTVFCGFVADARKYFRAFDALFLPSGAVEAFGMVALEAMVAGVPVICQRAAGPKDVLGELGCFYESPTVESMSEALQRFSSSPGDRTDYPRRASQRAEAEFSVPALARRLASFVDTGSRSQG